MPISTSDIAEQAQGSRANPQSTSSPTQDGGQSNNNNNGRNPSTGAGVNTGAGTSREKTEAELEADRLYEERMQEEYAKREGGA